MFGLIRFLISLAMLAAFVWFAVSVPLGKRTLWGHTRAIFGSQEAKDLAEGTKEEAERVARKEEPLWSEGASKAALPKNAPINMQSFVKLAGTLGPAVVNVVAIQTADGPDERGGGTGGPGGDKPRGHGRGQGTGFVIHKS